ncbi:MAG: polyphosphate kinase 2 family protein [Candidatus Melainabacteria bacterium]|jgi:PPK2 family polyphosphate:nucleotide phosphotransferase|nr:polyphosphate kinase 2 family protein [Candidatus Melainabacteria bacterium]OPZ88641.1 MAG: Polyphosphate kinase 2 (PPK2) [bacterium ADurb.Bin425]
MSKGKDRKAHLKDLEKLLVNYRVDSGDGFKLQDFDPSSTDGMEEGKERAQELLVRGVDWLSELQDRLYAQDKYALLCVFQAMDAAGKDGTIKHVMSGVNPQGCQVYSFKQPSSEDLDHDFMWRYMKCLPERGRIGIFNRSYYEEVLVVRVHDQLLQKEKIPERLITKKIWDERLQDIKAFERYLSRNGVVVLKFYLNLSKQEQKKRFLARIDVPEKNWKFSSADVEERGYWKDYAKAYQEAIAGTASEEAPWYVVPADNKWFTRLVVIAAIVKTLEKLDLRYPQLEKDQLKNLEKAKLMLQSEKK